MSVPNLPGQRHPIAGNLQCTPEFYRVLQQIAEYVRLQQSNGEGSASDIASLQDQITRLFATLGPLISTNGTGIVTRNGPQFAFVDPADSANVTLTLDYSADTLTADLTDLADTGTGALLAIERDAKGRITGTREATITGTAGQIDVADGDASSGLPTISLADLADSGAGSALVKITRDAKGRVSGTSSAVLSDLSDVSNTAPTGGYVLAWNATSSAWEPTSPSAASSPTTTKGDLIVRSATADDRLPVGTDGQIPYADSTQALGIRWGSAPSGASPTTTLGDIIVRGASGDVRLGVGTDGQVLTARSSATNGADWETPSGVSSVVAGTGIAVDNTDPANPVVSATGGGSGAVSLLSSTTFTSQVEASITGLPDNSDFRLVVTDYSQSSSADCYMQLQVDGSWVTAGYFWTIFGSQSGTGNSVSNISLCITCPSGRNDTITIDLTGSKTGEWSLAEGAFTYALHKILAVYSKSGRITGIKIFPASGTISCNIAVYQVAR